MAVKNHSFVTKEVHLWPGKSWFWRQTGAFMVGKITLLATKNLPSERVTIAGNREKSVRKS